MGFIKIEVGGSFVGKFGVSSLSETFSAMEHGHADAVARAIEHLSGTVLPRATALDHVLHEQSQTPRGGFTPKRIERKETL